jgi:hypothetical protein
MQTCLFQLDYEIIKSEHSGVRSWMNAFQPENKRTGPTRIGKMHGRDGNAIDTQETLYSVFGASLLLHQAEA